jgi:hypothetical protein
LTLEDDFALDEEFDFTELLLASSQSSQTLDEESSPGRTKLLSSSSQAASAKAMANAATAPTNLLNGAFLMIDILFVPSIQKIVIILNKFLRVYAFRGLPRSLSGLLGVGGGGPTFVKSACKQSFLAYFGGQIRFIGR